MGGGAGRRRRALSELDRLADAYLGDRSSVQLISRDVLAGRMRRGDVVVLDVRPEAEFRAGHVAGALSVPPESFARRLRGVPKDRDVVAYCRGPYFAYADEAVRVLRRRGYRASRLEDGYREWVRSGLPVEVW